MEHFIHMGLSFPFYCFPLFLCIVHLRRLSYFCWLFCGTFHSNGFIFPFLFCQAHLSQMHTTWKWRGSWWALMCDATKRHKESSSSCASRKEPGAPWRLEEWTLLPEQWPNLSHRFFSGSFFLPHLVSCFFICFVFILWSLHCNGKGQRHSK